MGTAQRHVFVDGYNVLHGWRWISPAAGASIAIAAARARLVEAVRELHDVDGAEVTVVFDGRAARGATHGPEEEDAGVAVLFAPAGLTADGAIERAVAGAAEPGGCIAASDDQLLCQTVRAAGGDCVSSAELAAWIERSRARVRRRTVSRASPPSPGLDNRLPL